MKKKKSKFVKSKTNKMKTIKFTLLNIVLMVSISIIFYTAISLSFKQFNPMMWGDVDIVMGLWACLMILIISIPIIDDKKF